MITLTDLQKVKLTIEKILDAMGQPAQIEGKPVWASSNMEVVTVEPAEDGMSAYAITVGPIGGAQVTVSADADLGEGVSMITQIEEITVLPSQAVSFGIAAGVPESK